MKVKKATNRLIDHLRKSDLGMAQILSKHMVDHLW